MKTLYTIGRLAYYEALLGHMQRRGGATHPDLPGVVIRIRELRDELNLQ